MIGGEGGQKGGGCAMTLGQGRRLDLLLLDESPVGGVAREMKGMGRRVCV